MSEKIDVKNISGLSGIKEYLEKKNPGGCLAALEDSTRKLLILFSVVLTGEKGEIRSFVQSCKREGISSDELWAVHRLALMVGGAFVLPRVKEGVSAIEEMEKKEMEEKEMENVEVYTDGACTGNPGPGGYAAVVVNNNKILKEVTGFCHDTTNNRMELTALIEALKALKNTNKIKIYTDSDYLLQGVKSWLEKWSNNGWKTAGGDNVKNRDLWEKIKQLLTDFDLDIRKVKAHSGNKYNERADSLAKEQIEDNI